MKPDKAHKTVRVAQHAKENIMKTIKGIKALILCTLFCAAATDAFAANYQSMTTRQLSQLRGTMYNTVQAEKDAFRAEWLKRVEQMNQEEREKYFGFGQGRRGGGLGDGSGRGRGGGADMGQRQRQASQ